MTAWRSSDDYQPIGWMGRVPLYATTLLVMAYVAAFLFGAVLVGSGNPALLADFKFIASWDIVRNFEAWRLLTYAFVNEPSSGLWFAIEMYLLYSFGREVEGYLGRRAFLLLYAVLLLGPPVVLTLLGLAGIPTAPPVVLAGSYAVNFAVFIAFVVIYPEALILFSLKAKWVAAILLAVYTVQFAAYHAWVPLSVLWLECLFAVAVLRMKGVANASLERWLPEREAEPVPRPVRRLPSRRKSRSSAAGQDLHDSINPLLEKISRQGIGSLTRAERARLENARNALIEQDKHSH